MQDSRRFEALGRTGGKREAFWLCGFLAMDRSCGTASTHNPTHKARCLVRLPRIWQSPRSCKSLKTLVRLTSHGGSRRFKSYSAHHRHLLPHSRLGVAVVFTFKIPARCEPLLGKSDTSLRCRCLNTTNPSNVKQSRKIAWIRGGIALPKTTGMSSSYFRTASWHVGAIHEVKHRD